jgi:hypothetical protein
MFRSLVEAQFIVATDWFKYYRDKVLKSAHGFPWPACWRSRPRYSGKDIGDLHLNQIAICPEGAASGPKLLLHSARDTVSI